MPGSRNQEKWHGHKTFEGRLSEAGLCDLTPRMASPERIGESSGSSGSGCAAPGGMAQRTGRCVSQSLKVGERARGARLCDTHSVPSAKKEHSANTTTRGCSKISRRLRNYTSTSVLKKNNKNYSLHHRVTTMIGYRSHAYQSPVQKKRRITQ